MCRSAEEYPPNGKRCGFGSHLTEKERNSRRVARNAREKELYRIRKNILIESDEPTVEIAYDFANVKDKISNAVKYVMGFDKNKDKLGYEIETPVEDETILEINEVYKRPYAKLTTIAAHPQTWLTVDDDLDNKMFTSEDSRERAQHILTSVQDDLAYVPEDEIDDMFYKNVTNDISRYFMKDGSTGYFKTYVRSAENGLTYLDYDHDALAMVTNEVAAYRLSQVLGENYSNLVPKTVLRVVANRLGTLQAEAKGKVASEDAATELASNYAPDFLRRAALFDYIAGSQDRHDNNFVIPPNPVKGEYTAVLIDNGFSFPSKDDAGYNVSNFLGMYIKGHEHRDLTDEDKVTLSVAKKSIEPGGSMFNYLSDAQRDFMSKRITKLEQAGQLNSETVLYNFKSWN